jgi:peptidyl-prolyl cis-trans isomerase D
VVSRAQPGDLSRDALEAVLAADATKLPAVVGVSLPGEGYLVARIDKLMARDIQPEDEPGAEGPVRQAWARAEAEAYYRALSTRYKATKQVKRPVSAAAAASAAGG